MRSCVCVCARARVRAVGGWAGTCVCARACACMWVHVGVQHVGACACMCVHIFVGWPQRTTSQDPCMLIPYRSIPSPRGIRTHTDRPPNAPTSVRQHLMHAQGVLTHTHTHIDTHTCLPACARMPVCGITGACAHPSNLRRTWLPRSCLMLQPRTPRRRTDPRACRSRAFRSHRMWRGRRSGSPGSVHAGGPG
jgi:hypothetical protein